MDFISSLKTVIVGFIASVVTTVAPVLPTYSQPAPLTDQVIASPVSSESGKLQTETPKPQSSAYPVTATSLPLNEENYLYARGTYSYLGQSIKYLFLIPKNGGGFSGSIEGVCQAIVSGDYKGGNGGEITGEATGTCSVAFIKYEGSVHFKGNLYPEDKKLVIKFENSDRKPIILNYN